MLAQLFTLLITVVIGFSIVVAPKDANLARLSEIEKFMDADHWGWALVAFGTIGFLAELWVVAHERDNLFVVISLCHLLCMALMVAFSIAALVGSVERGQWWNFAVPALGVYLGFMHYMYVQRKTQLPAEIVHDRKRR